MKRSPIKRRTKRIAPEERDYAAWIRKQPCACCGGNPPCEAAHTGKGGGMGLKAPWVNMIPLHALCHRAATNSYHEIGNEEKWAALHGIDLPAVIERLQRAYGIANQNALWARSREGEAGASAGSPSQGES